MIKNSSYIYRTRCTLRTLMCTVLCIMLLASLLCIGVQAEAVRDYRVTVDGPVSVVSENSPAIIRGNVQVRDTSLLVEGWVKTDHKIDHYLYTVDGGKTWVRDEGAVQSRPDVQSHCPTTYKTAGFRIQIDVSGLLDGKYDLFVRAITSRNQEINVLAMLDMTVGNVDEETLVYREINLERLGATDALSLSANKPVQLGGIDIGLFKSAEIITATEAVTVTLASDDKDSPLKFTKTFAAQNGENGEFIHSVDLTSIRYAGEVTLQADKDANISRIRFYYNTPDYYTGDLVIHMTSTPFDYLGGMNKADVALCYDDQVGTYTRFYPTENSNDPYVYFNIGSYLKETMETVVSADHYRYAVVTAQTPSTKSQGHFRLFLCAGAIRGPSGNSSIAFSATNDGKWNRYIIPLLEEDDWVGQIHGIRFDFIDGNVTTTDYANVASVGFYPDLESAQAAAKAPLKVHHEQGKVPVDKYQEEGRAPSGRADMITWFDQSLAPCFGGENKVKVSFDEYGHLLVMATEATGDPYVSFDMQTYATLTGTQLLSTDQYKYIVLRIMADKEIQGQGFVLYYYSGGLGYAEGTRAINANFKGGEWEYITYDMSNAPLWTQDILGMRLDISNQISAGQTVCISDILFFADEEAWTDYATQNGIDTGKGNLTDAEPTTEPETEAPTIEIPTQGPGLEYIPPEQPPSQGCGSVLALPALLIFPTFILAFIHYTRKKGD